MPTKSTMDKKTFALALGQAIKLVSLMHGFIDWETFVMSYDFRSGYDQIMSLSHLSRRCIVVVEESGVKAYNAEYKDIMWVVLDMVTSELGHFTLLRTTKSLRACEYPIEFYPPPPATKIIGKWCRMSNLKDQLQKFLPYWQMSIQHEKGKRNRVKVKCLVCKTNILIGKVVEGGIVDMTKLIKHGEKCRYRWPSTITVTDDIPDEVVDVHFDTQPLMSQGSTEKDQWGYEDMEE
ncbi:hypothetical protein ADUPG1_009789 [Aduncisulcus paluster]|uniref:Uncharacterized protein n=1 Tax=Aduncisulcus paluster TaxID=2918883 RepID=A0ABQ5KWT6_9EUKA|nr:hypothetical protein ADUPG1_009789 [Aduncisulcus paluster]